MESLEGLTVRLEALEALVAALREDLRETGRIIEAIDEPRAEKETAKLALVVHDLGAAVQVNNRLLVQLSESVVKLGDAMAAMQVEVSTFGPRLDRMLRAQIETFTMFHERLSRVESAP